MQAVERITREFRVRAQREVERIHAAYRANDYKERDSRPAHERHLKWLYRRVAYRESCQDIKERYSERCNAETISRKTRSIAAEIGVTIPK